MIICNLYNGMYYMTYKGVQGFGETKQKAFNMLKDQIRVAIIDYRKIMDVEIGNIKVKEVK